MILRESTVLGSYKLKLYQPAKMQFENDAMSSSQSLSPSSSLGKLGMDLWHSDTPEDHIVTDAPVSSVSLTKALAVEHLTKCP